MRNKIFISILAMVLLFTAGLVYGQYQTKVYHKQGGDELVVASSGKVTVQSGGNIDVESGGNFKLAGTAVTSSAAELNTLYGVASTLTATELNTLDGVASTLTYLELNILDGVTSDYAELNLVDGSIAGTAVASKAVVLSSTKSINGITNTVHTIDADSTLLATQSGNLFSAISIVAKRSYMLPTAAAGLIFKFAVDDTDSLRVLPNTGDKITDVSAEYTTAYTTVAGALTVEALDSAVWYVTTSTGTWTGY